jgi:translation elongation factor EF-1beta
MLGHILNPQETKEAEEELAELPDGAKWIKKKEEPKAFGRKRFRGEEKQSESVGSSQPWVGLLRAK